MQRPSLTPTLTPSPNSVAVVGAGVAGLACARSLSERGHQITVFDKGHSAGGRLSTRVVDGASFDLGAQYFTARDPVFEAQVRAWCTSGICAPWLGRVVSVSGRAIDAPRETEAQTRYVGTPQMGTLAPALAHGLNIDAGVCVELLSRKSDGRIALHGRRAEGLKRLGPAGLLGRDPAAFAELGVFDAVVLAMPPSQALWLTEPHCPELAASLTRVAMEPCFALGFASHDRAGELAALPFDAAFVGRAGEPHQSMLSWVARDSSKPGRSGKQVWVLHATPAWTHANLVRPESEVVAELLIEFTRLFGGTALAPETVTLMRWLLARAPEPLDAGVLGDAAMRVFCGGDWAHGGRVEGAYLSGIAIADAVVNALASARDEERKGT